MRGLVHQEMGLKYATGTETSSDSTIDYILSTGGNSNKYSITVSGLTFQASIILFTSAGADVYALTPVIFASAGVSTNDSANRKILISGINFFKLDGTSAYVDATGFRMPSHYASTSYNWYAWE